MTNEYHTNKNMNTWYIFELLNYILYHQIINLNTEPMNFQGPQNIRLSYDIFVLLLFILKCMFQLE